MRVVPNELRRLQPLERVCTAAEHAVLLAVLAARSSQSLGFFEGDVKAVFVNCNAVFLSDFSSQIEGEAEGVIK